MFSHHSITIKFFDKSIQYKTGNVQLKGKYYTTKSPHSLLLKALYSTGDIESTINKGNIIELTSISEWQNCLTVISVKVL